MKTTSLLFLAFAAAAFANDTSLNEGRFGPEPLTGESPVRMVAEHIEVAFGYRTTDVHCTFTFRNTRKAGIVQQVVGFPDVGAAADEAQRREPDSAIKELTNTSPLLGMRTFVNRKRVKTALRIGSAREGHDPDHTVVWSTDRKTGLRAWHTMKVDFPAGEDVTIERRYKVQNGASAAGVAFFQYTTATGGVWKGTIGRLQADVTLRDRLTVDGLVWQGAKVAGGRVDGDLATQPGRKHWQVLDKTHLRLVWNEFEPRTEPEHRGFSLSRAFHGW